MARELDENTPPTQTVRVMNDLMAEHPGADITMVIYPDAKHGLSVLPNTAQVISQDALYPNLAWYDFALGYIEVPHGWIREKTTLIIEN